MNISYSILIDYLNPFFNKIDIWKFLFKKVFLTRKITISYKVLVRLDTSVKITVDDSPLNWGNLLSSCIYNMHQKVAIIVLLELHL